MSYADVCNAETGAITRISLDGGFFRTGEDLRRAIAPGADDAEVVTKNGQSLRTLKALNATSILSLAQPWFVFRDRDVPAEVFPAAPFAALQDDLTTVATAVHLLRDRIRFIRDQLQYTQNIREARLATLQSYASWGANQLRTKGEKLSYLQEQHMIAEQRLSPGELNALREMLRGQRHPLLRAGVTFYDMVQEPLEKDFQQALAYHNKIAISLRRDQDEFAQAAALEQTLPQSPPIDSSTAAPLAASSPSSSPSPSSPPTCPLPACDLAGVEALLQVVEQDYQRLSPVDLHAKHHDALKHRGDDVRNYYTAVLAEKARAARLTAESFGTCKNLITLHTKLHRHLYATKQLTHSLRQTLEALRGYERLPAACDAACHEIKLRRSFGKMYRRQVETYFATLRKSYSEEHHRRQQFRKDHQRVLQHCLSADFFTSEPPPFKEPRMPPFDEQLQSFDLPDFDEPAPTDPEGPGSGAGTSPSEPERPVLCWNCKHLAASSGPVSASVAGAAAAGHVCDHTQCDATIELLSAVKRQQEEIGLHLLRMTSAPGVSESVANLRSLPDVLANLQAICDCYKLFIGTAPGASAGETGASAGSGAAVRDVAAHVQHVLIELRELLASSDNNNNNNDTSSSNNKHPPEEEAGLATLEKAVIVLRRLLDACKKMESEIHSTAAELSQTKRELGETRESANGLISRLESLCVEASAEQAKLQAQLAKLQAQNDLLASSLKSSESGSEPMRAEIQHLQKRIEEFRAGHEEQVFEFHKTIKNLKEELAVERAALAETRATHSQQLNSLREESQKLSVEQTSKHTEEVMQLRARHTEQCAQLETTHADQLTQLRAQLHEEFGRSQAQHRGECARLQGEHDARIQQLQAAHDARVQQLQTEHSEQLAQLCAQHSAQTKLSAQDEQIRHDDQMARMTVQHDDQMARMTAQHNDQIRQLQVQHDDLTSRHEQMIARLRLHDDQVRQLQDELTARATLEDRLLEVLLPLSHRGEESTADYIRRVLCCQCAPYQRILHTCYSLLRDPSVSGGGSGSGGESECAHHCLYERIASAIPRPGVALNSLVECRRLTADDAAGTPWFSVHRYEGGPGADLSAGDGLPCFLGPDTVAQMPPEDQRRNFIGHVIFLQLIEPTAPHPPGLEDRPVYLCTVDRSGMVGRVAR